MNIDELRIQLADAAFQQQVLTVYETMESLSKKYGGEFNKKKFANALIFVATTIYSTQESANSEDGFDDAGQEVFDLVAHYMFWHAGCIAAKQNASSVN
jgi:hypothetical protein